MNYPCPCCHNLTLSEQPPGTYQICPVCFWEDDPVQYYDKEFEGGANRIALIIGMENYRTFGACSEEFRSKVRMPTLDEIPRGGKED